MKFIEDIPICGEHDQNTINQIVRARHTVERAALCADGHYGFSVPIGGVVASQELISVEAVGFDIACGNKAVLTDADPIEVKAKIAQIMDAVARQVSFGIGRVSGWNIEHSLFESSLWNEIWALRQCDRQGKPLIDLAREQLGTVGSGVCPVAA